jgi:Tol biopolymer transport system component
MRRLTLLAVGLTICAIGRTAELKPAYELDLVDMQGHRKVLGSLPDSVVAPRVSPDGTRVSFEQTDPPVAKGAPSLTNIYVAELDALDKRKMMRNTVIAQRDISPVWAADSQWVAFVAVGNGSNAIFWERANGSEQPHYLTDAEAPEGMYPGLRMTLLTLKGDKDYGISMLDVRTRKLTPLVDLPGSAQYSSAISPDGKWLAYTSNETGRDELWIEPLPANGKRVQLTSNGGSHPLWAPGGKTLYFDNGGQMYWLEITTDGDRPRGGDPEALPIKGFVQNGMRRQYDLMPQGDGFVMLFPLAVSGGG